MSSWHIQGQITSSWGLGWNPKVTSCKQLFPSCNFWILSRPWDKHACARSSIFDWSVSSLKCQSSDRWTIRQNPFKTKRICLKFTFNARHKQDLDWFHKCYTVMCKEPVLLCLKTQRQSTQILQRGYSIIKHVIPRFLVPRGVMRISVQKAPGCHCSTT